MENRLEGNEGDLGRPVSKFWQAGLMVIQRRMEAGEAVSSQKLKLGSILKAKLSLVGGLHVGWEGKN